MIAWMLTVALANPPSTVEPQYVGSSQWASQQDCLQARELEVRIANLEQKKKNISCREVEILDSSILDKANDDLVPMIDDLLLVQLNQSWKRPKGLPAGISAEVTVNFGREGKVHNVRITRSSGSEELDSSAVAATLNAGDFSLIKQLDSETYINLYRERKIIFKPEK